MKAFVEVLSVVVRAGPDCDRYGLPFDFAIAASAVDGKTAIVKALVNQGNTEFTRAHASAIIRALKSPIPAFEDVDWDRFKISQQGNA